MQIVSQTIDTLHTLRQAAAALLGTAPEPVVRKLLRELLEVEPEAAEFESEAGAEAPHCNGNGNGNGAAHKPRRPRKPHKAPPPTSDPSSPSWLVLRRQIGAAMRRHGISEGQLATAIHFAHGTVHKALGLKTDPSRPLRAALVSWLADGAVQLEQAEAEAEDKTETEVLEAGAEVEVEVLEPPLPFRRNRGVTSRAA
jgi:hypothetical protein